MLLENTKIRTVSMVAAVVVLTGASWRGATILEGIRRDLQNLTAEAYTMDRASEVALRMAIENPGMRVINPRDPSQVIVVTASKISTGP